MTLTKTWRREMLEIGQNPAFFLFYKAIYTFFGTIRDELADQILKKNRKIGRVLEGHPIDLESGSHWLIDLCLPEPLPEAAVRRASV
jgi:hypothetical protein